MATRKSSTQNPPIDIDENLDIDTIQLSDTRALRVSLLSSKGNRYTSITRLYKTKSSDTWNPQRAIWIPFSSTREIAEILTHAHQSGVKIGWDKTISEKQKSVQYPSRMNVQEAVADAQKALDRLKDCLKATSQEQEIQEQLSLFERLRNRLFKE